MARNLSLAAYLAMTRREPGSMPDIDHARPAGGLVWLHVADETKISAMIQLGRRLVSQRIGLNLLLTVTPGMAIKPTRNCPLIIQQAPPENPTDIERFLSHWQPDLALWLGTGLRPALIDAAARSAVPLFLLDASEAGWEQSSWKKLFEPTKGALQLFDVVLTQSSAAADRLRRIGVAEDSILPSGVLVEESTALPYNENDMEELTTAIAGRPVWLAAKVRKKELNAILSAHRNALRMAHRSLLILVPESPEDSQSFAQICADNGWRFCRWSKGELPTENTQVLLAESAGEMGLWYRLAPVTFMGGSLEAGYGGHTPFDAAALGSAVLYGPGVGKHLDAYSRLAKAGAVRIVRDSQSLSQALIQLNAPDQVAAMAHAGWEVVSAGAKVTDQIIDLVQDALDAAGVD